jgi:hypothetical protein
MSTSLGAEFTSGARLAVAFRALVLTGLAIGGRRVGALVGAFRRGHALVAGSARGSTWGGGESVGGTRCARGRVLLSAEATGGARFALLAILRKLLARLAGRGRRSGALA